MKFFRGIAVSVDVLTEVLDNISEKGLHAGDGTWTILAPDLKKEYQDEKNWNRLLLCNDLNIDITRIKQVKTICACANIESAKYYACVHNKTRENTEPILIEIEAAIQNVWVDGRDFLYTVAVLWDRKLNSTEHAELVKNNLLTIFGEAFLPYLNLIFNTSTNEYKKRTALVDLAINDHEVIKSHANNQVWIKGRYNTLFRNAFLLKTPMLPSNIISITNIEEDFRYPDEFIAFKDQLG